MKKYILGVLLIVQSSRLAACVNIEGMVEDLIQIWSNESLSTRQKIVACLKSDLGVCSFAYFVVVSKMCIDSLYSDESGVAR